MLQFCNDNNSVLCIVYGVRPNSPTCTVQRSWFGNAIPKIKAIVSIFHVAVRPYEIDVNCPGDDGS